MTDIDKDKHISELYAQIRKLDAERDEAVRKNIKYDSWSKEIFERKKSQLQTVYYSLDKLAVVGTHHEKEVVIRYLRMLLEGFMKQDTLPFDYDNYNSLPF